MTSIHTRFGSFGSYGPRSPQRIFGRRGIEHPPASDEPVSGFGRRPDPQAQRTSLQRMRLSMLLSELQSLFGDADATAQGPTFILDEGNPSPRLLIGSRAYAAIDDETGRLVFVETSGVSETTIITASDERLLDHILCHLAADAATPDTADTRSAGQAARMLVGQPLATIERHAILQTLRHCQGNKTRTAKMLGVSLRTIRNKLRTYWLEQGGKGDPA